MTRNPFLLTAALTLAAASTAHAASVTVTGGSLETDVSGNFPPAVIPTASLNTSQTTSSTLATNTTTYDFTSTALNFTVQHTRNGTFGSFARSYGNINFTLQPAAPGATLGYTLAGNYALTDVGGGAGHVDFYIDLYDLTTASNVLVNEQLSRTTTNQSFTLGGSAGDFYNRNFGALTGTLIAGHNYEWEYAFVTNAYPDADNGASATGYLTLTFTDSSLPTASPDATPATPLPAAALLPLPLLLALPLLRRRNFHQH